MTVKSKNIYDILDSDDEEVIVPVSKPPKSNKVTDKPKATSSKNKKSSRGGKSNRDSRGRGNSRGSSRRDYDRRSGTGHGRETQRHGGGSHNWGNEYDTNEIEAEAEINSGNWGELSDNKKGSESDIKENIDDNNNNKEDNEENEENEEEETNQMTVDEYMEMKKSERSGELFKDVEIRQISNEFNKATLITKADKTPDFIETKYEKVYRERSSGRKKQLFEGVGFRAADRFSRGGNRGGNRGGSRGGARGNGGYRGRGGGYRANKYAPNVSDMKSFPTLG